jgi:hypothetical protein
MGGPSSDYVQDVTVDGEGSIFVSGTSYQPWGSPIRPYKGSKNIFAARLSFDGQRLWNTFLGSGQASEAFGIAVNPMGSLYVTGNSSASWGSPLQPYEGPYDGFLTRLAAYPQVAELKSQRLKDGWLLESSETSGAADRMNHGGPIAYVGDNGADKQYRAILSFKTANIPADAEIIGVQLKLHIMDTYGAPDPLAALGPMLLDVKTGFFAGSKLVQLADFDAAATKRAVTEFGVRSLDPSETDWVTATLPASAYLYLDRLGLTQFRLRMTREDNDDSLMNALVIASGSAAEADRPRLLIYYVTAP